MQCFYHMDRPAVGVCRHCFRGLCTECATSVDDVLACRGRHEAAVRALNEVARQSAVQFRRNKASYVRNAVFYGLVGTVFVGFGGLQYRFLGLQAAFFILIGVFLVYAAGANLVESGKYK
jgi:hypothetical protein